MKIEKPDLVEIATRDFDEWFDKYVEPINKMLAEGIEVYNFEEIWHPVNDAYGDERPRNKALLIQPIKKETAEDVLRDLVEMHESDIYSLLSESYSRAKAVLNEK